MKKICILAVVAILASSMLPAQESAKPIDAAALFKEKCVMCHGEKGDGNKDMGMPAVKGTELTAEKLATFLLKGEQGKTVHANPLGQFNEEQAKAVAAFIKSLK